MDALQFPAMIALWVAELAFPLHGRNSWRLGRLLLGLTFAQGRRTVTSWLRAAGVTDGYRSYYYFLDSCARKAWLIGLALLRISLRRNPPGDALRLTIDDTPSKRSGPRVQGAGRHYNPTPGTAGSRTLFGHSWVVIARVARHTRFGLIGLPLWAALYVREVDVGRLPEGAGWTFRTKLTLAAEMIAQTASALSGHWSGPVWLMVDGGYAKREVFRAAAQARWTLVTRLRKDAHLNDLPPTPTPDQKRRRGRPRKYGPNRLSLAIRAGQGCGWETVSVRRLDGRWEPLRLKSFVATWRVAGGPVRVVIIDGDSSRGRPWRAYACTDTEATAQRIAQATVERWACEQVNHDVKEVEHAAQVQLRRVWANVGAWNLALWAHSLVELWAWAKAEGTLVDRSASPWDTLTRRPSHADRRRALQREVIAEEFRSRAARGGGAWKIRRLAQAVLKLVA